MTVLSASQTRIPTEAFNQVVYKGKRIEVRRRDGRSLYLISKDELAYYEKLEDVIDAKEGLAALRRYENGEEEAIPFEVVKKRLG